jgi:hypothetical protein
MIFTFRSGPTIFDRVMALGLLAKYLVDTTLFHYASQLIEPLV